MSTFQTDRIDANPPRHWDFIVVAAHEVERRLAVFAPSAAGAFLKASEQLNDDETLRFVGVGRAPERMPDDPTAAKWESASRLVDELPAPASQVAK